MAQILGQPFGRGKNQYLTISSDTVWTSITGVVVVSCSGTIGATTLSATGSFNIGDVILIHHSRGTTGNTGGWELNKIKSYTAGTITLVLPLVNTYTDSGVDQSQVQTLPEFNRVVINSGNSLTAAAWDGDTGGIIAFLCSGETVITGTISANGKGYLGASLVSNQTTGKQGEGTVGNRDTQSQSANGNGGGGAFTIDDWGGGGGGGNGTAGETGPDGQDPQADGGIGGSTSGAATLATATFGGGGGSGTATTSVNSGAGGDGGGIIFITTKIFTTTGSVTANGSAGGNGSGAGAGGGGGGGGGSILIKCQTTTLGSNLITATGGAYGNGGNPSDTRGGAGGDGRIRIEALSRTGTTNPSASESIGSGNSWSGRIGLIN